METDIDNFIDITRLKNGEVKLKKTSSTTAQGNIYRFLRDEGFRISNLNRGAKYYRRQLGKVIPATFEDIKSTFKELLESDRLTNVPTDVSKRDIINWYYSASPVKKNALFKHYLKDTLSDSEAHEILLLTDHNYRHDFEIKQLLSKFDEWNFSTTTDGINSYSSNNPPLYYKRIDEKKYLVFNHWNLNSKFSEDGFDGWIATYSDEQRIGKEKPLDLQQVRLGFILDRDFPLIEQYID